MIKDTLPTSALSADEISGLNSDWIDAAKQQPQRGEIVVLQNDFGTCFLARFVAGKWEVQRGWGGTEPNPWRWQKWEDQ